MDWITIDRARVLGALSASRRQMYEGWIVQYPEKADRVDEIIANLVMEFRSGIEANPLNYLDPDEAKLPQSCVRYCETLITFHLCGEMGATVSEAELLTVQKAEIYLRYLFTGRFFITGGDGSNAPTPSYVAAVVRAARELEG